MVEWISNYKKEIIMAKRGRKPKEDLKPGRYFMEIYENETDVNQNMEVRFVQAAKVWKTRNECGIPYQNFQSFKRSFYESLKSEVLSQ